MVHRVLVGVAATSQQKRRHQKNLTPSHEQSLAAWCDHVGVSETSRTTYDSDVTPELRENMKHGWSPRHDEPAIELEVAAFAHARRATVSTRFPGDVLVVPAGRMKARSNDTFYRFRSSSEHTWLTGHQGEACVLVMFPTDTGHHSVLFIIPPAGRETDAWYRDRDRGEIWVGPRPGLVATSTAFAIETRPLSGLRAALVERTEPARVIRGFDPEVDALLAAEPTADSEFTTALHELRLIKDSWEVGELEKAVQATKLGFEDVIAELPYAGSERWLEGTFLRRARYEGNDVGYGSIVACGSHACTLHWTDNDGAVREGDLALLDMGVEIDSLYTADITRTIPVAGTFTEPQRAVYEAVLEAQLAGIAAVQPGAGFMDPNTASMRVLLAHLIKWGILSGDESDLMRAETFRRYTLHNVSHMLGMDVHDCAKARAEYYRDGTLKSGMALTVEPGLYFQIDDLTVPEEFRGIGVRIEDDVLVTDDGCRVLSHNIPKDADAVEAWVASCQFALIFAKPGCTTLRDSAHSLPMTTYQPRHESGMCPGFVAFAGISGRPTNLNTSLDVPVVVVARSS